MASPHSPLLLLVIINVSSFFHFLLMASRCAATGGFSAEFIHRDSPHSPLFDPTHKPSQRMRAALLRDARRGEYIRSSLAQTVLPYGRPARSHHARGVSLAENYAPSNEMLVKLSVGTPPVDVFVVPDTGSDLLWIPCKPCRRCDISQGARLFDAANSTTYRALPCDWELCKGSQFVCGVDNQCRFTTEYGDGSSAAGTFGTETFTFESADGRGKVAIPRIAFACAQNRVKFEGAGDIGIAGMDLGNASLLVQLSPHIDRKFSHCIARRDSKNPTGRFFLGSEAASATRSGEHVARTALRKPFLEHYEDYADASPLQVFYVELEEIRVGGVQSPIPYLSAELEQLIAIDTGTTVINLPRPIFEPLVTAVSSQVGFPSAKDPEGLFERCYRVESPADIDQFPDLVMGLTGANVTLKAYNYVMSISQTVACVGAVAIADEDTPIWGNTALQGLHVAYDLVKREVSFARTDDCSEL